MRKLFPQLVAFLLVPCLIADPSLAAALSYQQSVMGQITQNPLSLRPFQEEALTLSLLAIDHPYLRHTAAWFRRLMGRPLEITEGSAIRFSGEGLGETDVNLDGKIVRIDLHALLTKAMALLEIQKAKPFPLNTLLSPAEFDSLPLGYRQALNRTMRAISVNGIEDVRFLFLARLESTYYSEIVRELEAKTNQQIDPFAIRKAALSLSNDLLLHAGLGGGAHNKPSVYGDSKNLAWLKSLPAEQRARFVLHELLHIAARLQNGRHLSESDVQLQDEMLAIEFELMPFSDLLRSLAHTAQAGGRYVAPLAINEVALRQQAIQQLQKTAQRLTSRFSF